jgi:hypothetical protein
MTGLTGTDRRNIPLPKRLPEPIAPGAPTKPPRISKKIKAAIGHLITMEHPRLEDAAKAAGMTTYQLREALKRVEVVRHLQAERLARIESACASNPEALLKIRDTTENAMAAVQAAKALEAMRVEENATGRGIGAEHRTPGVVIVISDSPSPRVERRTIEIVPQPEPEPEPEAEPVQDAGQVVRGIYRQE